MRGDHARFAARRAGGKVVIVAKIAPDGTVDSATPDINTLTPAVGNCIARAVRNATFAAPGGTGSTLKIPITFARQGSEDGGT